MRIVFRMLMIFLLLTCYKSLAGQTENPEISSDGIVKNTEIYGFIRGGCYAALDKDDSNTPYMPSAFSDLALKINTSNDVNFRAFADMRFRYGVEFQEPASSIYLHEAYVKVYGKKWDIAAGQQIIKWGKTDFVNPVSRLNPQNYIIRSPEREDMDMGNIMADFKLHPFNFMSFEAALVPYYRSSVLLIDPIPIPEFVTINQINSLLSDKEMFSYGLKTDLRIKHIDASISWFEGFDPMPGMKLTSFILEISGTVPQPLVEFSFKPYKTRVIGFDFESSIADFGIRGETAWSDPLLSYEEFEYVPLPEISWVTGVDYSINNWRFMIEYSGKSVLDYTTPSAEPVFGTELDFTMIGQLVADPGFDIGEYIRQQVSAFNRLYNYQIERCYHSFGTRIETDLAYGRLAPSLNAMYNITSKDLVLIPEIKIKPSDRLSIITGFEYYRGIDGSLYDLVDDFMNNFYAAIRIDF
ncbi:MAG TPA: hypothetical protein VMV47_18075 [Bacteroidales bacterium]|nr:hypothetical protein [Bacteroidales bacterium]